MTSPITGAWQNVSGAYDGFYLLTDNHFCYFWARKERPAISGQPSDEDAATLFRSMSARAGVNNMRQQDGTWINSKRNLIAATPDSVGSEHDETWSVGEGGKVARLLLPDGATFDLEKVSELGSSRFAGAWELVSDTYEGLMIRTDTYYCALVTRRNRPVPQGSQPSVSEAAALYRAAQTAVVGTYTIDGMKTTTRTLVDRNPALVGRESTRVWRFEDDRAIGMPEGGGAQAVWRKIG